MSPSMPTTSVTWLMRREPSRKRSTWTMRFSADAICSRMARVGRSKPAISTIVSRRASASRGALACTVESEPSWPGVHRLEHVQGLGAADLTDDDAIGAHAQGVAHEIANGDLALAFDVGRARLEADHVLLAQLELDGILDRDDALVPGNEARQHVEQRRLAGAGAARDEDVHAALDSRGKHGRRPVP